MCFVSETRILLGSIERVELQRLLDNTLTRENKLAYFRNRQRERLEQRMAGLHSFPFTKRQDQPAEGSLQVKIMHIVWGTNSSNRLPLVPRREGSCYVNSLINCPHISLSSAFLAIHAPKILFYVIILSQLCSSTLSFAILDYFLCSMTVCLHLFFPDFYIKTKQSIDVIYRYFSCQSPLSVPFPSFCPLALFYMYFLTQLLSVPYSNSNNWKK